VGNSQAATSARPTFGGKIRPARQPPAPRSVPSRFPEARGRISAIRWVEPTGERGQPLADPADPCARHRQKAGTVEHAHDELKNALGALALPSPKLGANASLPFR
jgi:hypothetical protein